MLKRILKIAGRVSAVIMLTVVILVGTLYVMLQMCCNGPSEAARSLFITTILETGQMKFLASWMCSEEEIQAIVNQNSMEKMDEEVNKDLIVMNPIEDTQEEGFDENGIKIVEVSGRTFFGKMMIIKNPAQVELGTTYPWGEYGKNLDVIVSNAGAIAGVNGGIYLSEGNKGGRPMGIVVSQGKILYNRPSDSKGLYLVGMNNDNILVIKDIDGMTPSQFEAYVKQEGIRDAIAFPEEKSDANNHFVPLIINGQARELNGMGSGANPRTAVGQRADGAIMFLVTDGRGVAGHLGATASDLIGIMQEYGAVNAANIDGGSSSTMVYNGQYEMTSVTFYFSNASWKLPTAFVVKPKSEQ